MAHFAKRHYQAIATVIQSEAARAHTAERRTAVEDMAFSLGQMFAKDNPQFNRALFDQACIPGNNVRARKVA